MKKLIIICFILSCTPMLLSAQLTADFSMDVTTGCSPLTVNFTDQSTPEGEVVSWGWNFYSEDTLHYEQNPSFTFFPLGDHNICLTVENAMGEEDTHCETIIVYPGINSWAQTITNAGCEGENLGSVDINVSGGDPGYTFTWSNGASTEDVAGLSHGPYWVTITDINGCDGTFFYQVPGAFSIDFDSTLISCPGGNDGSILINSITNGTPPYTYLWSNGESTDEIIDLTEGLYTVTVTDATDCSFVESVGMGPIPGMEVQPSISQPNCFNGQIGSLNVFVTGGNFPYTYLWSNGVETAFNPGLQAGTYVITITDALNCTKLESYEIIEAQDLELFFNVNCPTSVDNGSISLSVFGGEPPYTYLWSPGLITTQNLTNIGPGTYQVTVTDNANCSAIESVELGSSIIEMIGGDTTYCDASTAQLEVIAPSAVSYEWSAGNLSCYDCPNPVATVGLGEETFYSVTVTESDGCIDIGYLNFDIQSYLDFDLLLFSNSPVLPGEDILFDCNVFNAQSVNWNGPENFTSDLCDPVISSASNLNAGTYSVDIIDQFGCAASSNPEVIVYQIIEAISNDTFICLGEPVQLEVIAPTAVSFEWTPAVGLDDPSIANPVAIPSGPTFYTVTVMDANGFEESITVYIDGIVPIPDVVSPEILICNGTEIEICAEGIAPGIPDIFYTWTGPNGFQIEGTCFTFEAGFEEGCYYFQYNNLYISDTLCNSFDSICIDLSDSIFIDPVMNLAVCEGESIQLSANINSQVNVALWEWGPPEFLSCTDCESPTASVLETTTFYVTVTDIEGCQESDSLILTIDPYCVWPGDTDTSKMVDNFDLLNIGLAYDSIGPLRPNASLNWVGQAAPDWWQTAPDGTNYKHVDCDGNGIINADDTLAITQNWGEVHNFTGEEDDQFFGSNYPQSGLLMDVPFYVDPDTLIEGESYALPIILGEMDNPAENVYGLAFSLEYDSSVIVPGSVNINSTGWIGIINSDMIAIQKDFSSPGRVDIGITRIDGMPITGFGEMGILNITIEDDILFDKGNDNRDADALEVVFKITNVLVINHLGEEIPIDARETTTILEETVSTYQPNLENFIDVRPNPVDAKLSVSAKNIKLERLRIFSTTGVLVKEWQLNDSSLEINTQDLPIGTYILKIQTDQGAVVKKVVVLR